MNKIKFGLKLWSNNQTLPEACDLINKGIFDYVELLAEPGKDVSNFEKAKIPYILHVPHDSFRFNIGEEKSFKLSLEILKQNIELADRISAKYLILHPGFGEVEIAKRFLEKIHDNRILIENMPLVGKHGEKMIGHNLEQIRQLQKDRFGFCLDFEHATKAAINLKTDPKKFIEKFMALKPKVFHICDGVYQAGPDNHLNIDEGEYDFKFFIDCIKKNDSKMVTLETPKGDLKSLKQDLENLKKLKKYFTA